MSNSTFQYLWDAAVESRSMDPDQKLVGDELLDEILKIGVRNQSVPDRRGVQAEIREAIRHQLRTERGA